MNDVTVGMLGVAATLLVGILSYYEGRKASKDQHEARSRRRQQRRNHSLFRTWETALPAY